MPAGIGCKSRRAVSLARAVQVLEGAGLGSGVSGGSVGEGTGEDKDGGVGNEVGLGVIACVQAATNSKTKRTKLRLTNLTFIVYLHFIALLNYKA